MMYTNVETLLNLVLSFESEVLLLIIKDMFKSSYKEKSKISEYVILSTVCTKYLVSFIDILAVLCFLSTNVYRKIRFSVKTSCIVH